MATICPTVLAENSHQFREQVERVTAFTSQIHLDFTDGEFVDSRTIDLSQAWWPDSMQANLHLMYRHPDQYIDELISLKPQMVIVHAEAVDDLPALADAFHQANIQVGVALLPETPVSAVSAFLSSIDHILIFSGHLGHFGGQADFQLLPKVAEVKKLNSKVTVGWDGGVNADNIKQLAEAGVDVLNVGGFIQRAEDPSSAYQELQKLLQ